MTTARRLRALFMGTPEFAVASLAALHADPRVEVVGVVTAPDKPAGRGQQLQASPVKQFALAHGLPVLQPEKLKDPQFHDQLRALTPDVAFVVAFRMLPAVVFDLPPLGSINLHASLLPDLRGAAPIHWAIIHGLRESGVTSFRIQQEVDTGPLLLQARHAIPDDWTTGQLYEALMQLGANVLVQTAHGLLDQTLTPQPQDSSLAVHAAPKLQKDDARIDWQLPSEQLYHFIRGMSPFPGAWTEWVVGEAPPRLLKVLFAKRVGEANPLAPPGTLRRSPDGLLVATGDGWLELAHLQLEGRKALTGKAFAAGIPPGELPHLQ